MYSKCFVVQHLNIQKSCLTSFAQMVAPSPPSHHIHVCELPPFQLGSLIFATVAGASNSQPCQLIFSLDTSFPLVCPKLSGVSSAGVHLAVVPLICLPCRVPMGMGMGMGKEKSPAKCGSCCHDIPKVVEVSPW